MKIVVLSLFVAFTSMSSSLAFEALEPGVSRRMNSVLGKTLPEPVNCWGIALYALGFIETVRPAFKTEVLDLVSSGACRRLGPSDAVRTGDIGSMYNFTGGISHSYLILDSNHVFEKGSPSSTDKPEIVNVQEKFGRTVDLRAGCKDGVSGNCNLGIVNYRCVPTRIQSAERSLDEVSQRRRALINNSLESLIEKLKTGGNIHEALSQHLHLMEEVSRDVDAGTISPRVEREAASRLLTIAQQIALSKSAGPQASERLLKLFERYDKMEAATPKSFDDFPDSTQTRTR